MSVQVYSLPVQTEGRSKAFLEWTSIDLYSKVSLSCGGNDHYYESIDVLGVLNNIIITNLSYSICPGKELEQTFGQKLA